MSSHFHIFTAIIKQVINELQKTVLKAGQKVIQRHGVSGTLRKKTPVLTTARNDDEISIVGT